MSLNKTAIPAVPVDVNPGLLRFLQAIKVRFDTVQSTELPVYTTEELKATVARLHTGKLVRCSNGNAGAECLAYCDGLNWKIIELGATVSTT